MTCILTEEDALEEIELGLKNLKKVISDDEESKGYLRDLTKASKEGIREVNVDVLTTPTCMEVSSLMLDGEADTRAQILALGVPENLLREHVQLMLIHQTMARVSRSQGINEGPKTCEPQPDC